MSIVPGQPLDESTRRRLRDLIRAVAGDTSPAGSQLAGERIKVLAPAGVVTVELATYIARVLALAVSHCPRCLDPSIGLCNPCRPAHAAELAAAIRGEPAPELPPAPLPSSSPAPAREAQADDVDPERSCFSKHQYTSEVDAKRVADRCFAQRGVRLRPYQCQVCGGYWHLTKQLTRSS